MKLRACSRVADGGVKQIDAKDLQPLWISDYYDGPLAGTALFEGQFCCYVLADEEQEPYLEGWYRRYWLVALTPAQRDEEQRWHDLFRKHVGTHWDQSGTEPRHVLPQENHHLFYEPYSKRTPVVLDDNDVVGWFHF